MKKGNDCGFDIQATSSNDLLRKYKIKVENDKSLKEGMQCTSNQRLKTKSQQDIGTSGGNIQKLDTWTQCLEAGNAIGTTKASQAQHKKQDQRKQSLNNIAAVQPTLERSKKGIEKISMQENASCVENNFQRQKSINTPQVQLSIEEPASKGTFHKNNVKRQLRNEIENQVQCSMKEQASKSSCHKNTDKRQWRSENENQGQTSMKEQASKVSCHDNTIKRKIMIENDNQVQASMEESQVSKKKKTTQKCPAMSLDDYLKKHKEQYEVEELEDVTREESEEDINYESEEVEEANESRVEDVAPKRKRGKTLCRKIHTREPKDIQQITLNEEGQPIGPDDKTVSEFTSFLGTIARSSDFCPLSHTSWVALKKSWLEEKEDLTDPTDRIWDYINSKYTVDEKGKKTVFAIINDAWRRYKCAIKQKHFSKYNSMRERWKNRPEEIPDEDFKKLLQYWRLETVQEISDQNAQNIAQLKWRHKTGPTSFARIREKLRERKEDKEPPTQAEVFIATRQSKKGKELDQETTQAITKLQDLIQNSGQSSSEAFQSLCGKEKPGRVRCHGRTTTPTLLKKNEEILEIKKQHADEVQQFLDKIQEIEEKREREKVEAEEKRRQDMAAMEQKFQLLLKTMVNSNGPGLNVEALAALLSSPVDANSVLRSSTSTHTPCNTEANGEEDRQLEAEDEE